MKRKYELTVIFSPETTSKDLTKASKEIESLVTDEGGKTIKREDWGLKEIATPIKKYSKGVYRFYKIEMPPEAIKKLNDKFKLSEQIIRHLFVAVG
jgi:small subunit ribosomal protein S6